MRWRLELMLRLIALSSLVLWIGCGKAPEAPKTAAELAADHQRRLAEITSSWQP